MLNTYIENLANNKEIYLKVKVLPKSGKTDFVGKMTDGTIKIAVSAAPENGKANQELLKFLAAEMGVRKYQVKIVSGAGDRIKLIKVSR